jgi:hypothetical protein
MREMNIKTDDNGISESIGFLLIFTMVIVGIGLVTLYGYPMLLREQTSADTQIMQKSMIVLQNDVKSLTFKTVPYKETMLNTGSGSLTVYNSLTTPSISEITIRDDTTGQNYVENFHPGDLRYSSTSAGVEVSLQNGAVVTRNMVEPGSAMLAQPRWFYDSQRNTMVINLISFNSSTKLSTAGVGNVQMRMNQTNFSAITPTGSTVCMRYTFPVATQNYELAWDNYFVHTMMMTKGSGACAANEYRLPVSTGTLVIKEYDVEIVTL